LFHGYALQDVLIIKVEHPDDPQAVFNDRVKGQLKVITCDCSVASVFDCFLSLLQSKINDALLEMFHIDNVGTLAVDMVTRLVSSCLVA
jgi:hypothetical protein